MNLGNLTGAGSAVAGYIQTPEGQDAIRKFLASPQGAALLKEFASTPEGMNTMAGLLPDVVGKLNIPPEAQSLIQGALAARQ